MTTTRVPGERSRHPRSRFRSGRQGSLAPFLAPAVAILVAIGLLPLVSTFDLSFRSFSFILPGRDGEWVGLDNYAALLSDESFKGAIIRTVGFTVAAVFLEVVAGLLLAAALNVTTVAAGCWCRCSSSR